jgi:hypothetical protein
MHVGVGKMCECRMESGSRASSAEIVRPNYGVVPGTPGTNTHTSFSTPKLLRPPSGIPVAGEAQRAAVQAQQRRERADRRNLVREPQSRMQVFPSATPSERITECLSRGCSNSPKATSHGPRGIVSHERDIEGSRGSEFPS